MRVVAEIAEEENLMIWIRRIQRLGLVAAAMAVALAMSALAAAAMLAAARTRRPRQGRTRHPHPRTRRAAQPEKAMESRMAGDQRRVMRVVAAIAEEESLWIWIRRIWRQRPALAAVEAVKAMAKSEPVPPPQPPPHP
jgi:hypothetical protein